METSGKTKKLIGGIVGVIVILVGMYFLLGVGSPPPVTGLQTGTSTSPGGSLAAGTVASTAEIIQRLNEIKSLEIDTSLFNSPAFLSLRDFSVRLAAQPVGRKNPFLPATYVPSSVIIIFSENPVEPTAFSLEGTEAQKDEEAVNQPESTETGEPADGTSFTTEASRATTTISETSQSGVSESSGEE